MPCHGCPCIVITSCKIQCRISHEMVGRACLLYGRPRLPEFYTMDLMAEYVQLEKPPTKSKGHGCLQRASRPRTQPAASYLHVTS